MITAHEAARDEAVAIFTSRIHAITKLAQDAPTTYVVRVGQHLYVDMDENIDGRLTGVEAAATFGSEYAAGIVAQAYRNGSGKRGQAVKARHAYRDEIEHLLEMRDLIIKSAQQESAQKGAAA